MNRLLVERKRQIEYGKGGFWINVNHLVDFDGFFQFVLKWEM